MRCLLAISLEVKALPEHRPLGSGTFIDNIVYAVACGDVCWELAACQGGIVGARFDYKSKVQVPIRLLRKRGACGDEYGPYSRICSKLGLGIGQRAPSSTATIEGLRCCLNVV